MREILEPKTVGLALAIVAVWAVVVVISGIGINWFPNSWSFENTGQFGDSFGSLSAIMASLAALSAVATFRTTREEISRTRESDRLRAEEIEKERERSRLRERSEDKRLAKAEFERTYFQLVDTFNSIVSGTDIVTQAKPHPQTGRDAFKSILATFERYRQTAEDEGAYQRLSARFQNDLNHYFRFMYHVISFVDGQLSINRYFYVRLFRALLSDAELALLALNCTYGDGRAKFKPLLEEYALLHNISPHYRALLQLDGKFEPGAFDLPIDSAATTPVTL